jgi:DNA-directed RNA polymerase subunit RPC12/RpoP
MSRTFCPKCDKDIFSTVYDLELREINFQVKEKFECPYCGIKLLAYLEAEYCVEEDESASLENQKTMEEKK